MKTLPPFDSTAGVGMASGVEVMRAMTSATERARASSAIECVSHGFVHAESSHDVSGRTHPPPTPTVESVLSAFDAKPSFATWFARFLGFYSPKTWHKCRQNQGFAFLPLFWLQKIWQKCRKNERYCETTPRGGGLKCGTQCSLKIPSYESTVNHGGIGA